MHSIHLFSAHLLMYSFVELKKVNYVELIINMHSTFRRVSVQRACYTLKKSTITLCELLKSTPTDK